jgi:hypothetical protein
LPNKIELAWAAGFYDGEGCIYCHHYGNKEKFVPRFSVSQNRKEPLFRFQKAVGGCGRVVIKKRANRKTKTVYAFEIYI